MNTQVKKDDVDLDELEDEEEEEDEEDKDAIQEKNQGFLKTAYNFI